MKSKLELIIGPMFSGKSTELIRRIRLLQKIDKCVLVVKPIIDIRYNINTITSHNFEQVECITLKNLRDLEDISKFNNIIIDEGQFFDDLFEVVIYWLNNYNINIIIGGLDGDYKQDPIGDILRLIPYADKCKKIASLCKLCNDGTKAIFSHRMTKNNEQVQIGGAESYVPLCRNHYTVMNELYNNEKN